VLRKLAMFVVLSGFTAAAGAATAPYSNNFDGTGSNVDLDAGGNGGTEVVTSSAGGAWTVGSGAYTLNVTNTPNAAGANNVSTAALPVTSVNTGNWFISSQFTVNSVSADSTAGRGLGIGFGAFGSTSTFSSTGTNKYYLADFSYLNGGTGVGGAQGTVRILTITSGGNTTVASNVDAIPDGALVNGTTYTLRLSGTYAGTPGSSALTMTLGVYDAAGTTLIGSSVVGTDAAPLSGANFGYRINYNDGGKSYNVSFDNLQVVPEPASMSLLGLAGLIALRRRSRCA